MVNCYPQMGELMPEEVMTIWFYDNILMEKLLKS